MELVAALSRLHDRQGVVAAAGAGAVKIVFVARARADLSTEEFQSYWLNVHGAKVAAAASVLRARRYVQSHAVAVDFYDALRRESGASEPYDGITEIWWDSVADLEAALSDPNAQEVLAAIGADEENFVDRTRSTKFVTHEYELFAIDG